MDELRIGLAGYGRFARLHARVYADLSQARVAAVCDPDPTARERAGRDLPDAAVFTSLEELLDAGGIDAIDVVSDETAHGTQALAALERDLPVFVEKPLATEVEEALAIREAAAARGLPVVVGYVSRFDHRYALVREAIRGGRLGRVAAVNARRGFSRAWFEGFGARVHPVFESMIHDIDLALWYLGAPVEQVFARTLASGGGDVPDVLAAIATASDGRMITLQSSWLVPGGALRNQPGGDLDPLDLPGTIDAQLEVTGTDGAARVVLDDGPRVWTDDDALSATGLWPSIHGRMEGAIRAELAHFCACARAREPSMVVPLDDAVAAVGVADAIVRSAAAGEAVTVRC